MQSATSLLYDFFLNVYVFALLFELNDRKTKAYLVYDFHIRYDIRWMSKSHTFEILNSYFSSVDTLRIGVMKDARFHKY